MSSSDDSSSISSEDEEFELPPALPKRPPNYQDRGNNLGNSDETRPDSGSNLTNCSNMDSRSQTDDFVSKNSGDSSQKSYQNSAAIDKNAESAVPGNTFNNFLEICTKSLPRECVSPKEVNQEATVPGGLQEKAEESSSSRGTDMGGTKYKEITEEPDEPQGGENADTECGNAGGESAGRDNAADIPGLQEIQEGLIEDDDDVADTPKHQSSVSLKHDNNILQGNLQGTLLKNVEIVSTETSTSIENDTGELQDVLIECKNTPSVTETKTVTVTE